MEELNNKEIDMLTQSFDPLFNILDGNCNFYIGDKRYQFDKMNIERNRWNTSKVNVYLEPEPEVTNGGECENPLASYDSEDDSTAGAMCGGTNDSNINVIMEVLRFLKDVRNYEDQRLTDGYGNSDDAYSYKIYRSESDKDSRFLKYMFNDEGYRRYVAETILMFAHKINH